MATTLADFLTPLKTLNVQIVVKDLEQENICKIYADTITSLDENLSARTVNRWDIVRNNLLNVYLNDAEEIEIISVDGITLDVESVVLNVGETVVISPTISPSDATNQNVTWFSSNEDIATVSDGIVSAVSEGTVSIVATTEDGGFTATCIINISASEEVVSVTSIALSETELTLVVGSEPIQLTAIIEPEDATDKTISWGTSDESIVTVVDGLVTPISEGSATISAITNDGGFIATCNVIVSTE